MKSGALLLGMSSAAVKVVRWTIEAVVVVADCD